MINLRDIEGKSALTAAAYHRHYDIASLLLKKGADPNAQDEIGRSVLAMASYKGYTLRSLSFY